MKENGIAPYGIAPYVVQSGDSDQFVLLVSDDKRKSGRRERVLVRLQRSKRDGRWSLWVYNCTKPSRAVYETGVATRPADVIDWMMTMTDEEIEQAVEAENKERGPC